MSKISDTVDKLLKLSKNENVVLPNNSSSSKAAAALSILESNSITTDDLKELFSELSKIELPPTAFDTLVLNANKLMQTVKPSNDTGRQALSPKKTLANWFFRLCHPSNGGGGKALREWLIKHEVSLTFIQQYFDIEITDILDFSAGFILGVGKSLTYDNIKGLYDLLGFSVDVQLLINSYQIDLLNNLVRQYEEKSEKSIEQAIQSGVKLQEAIKETLVNKKADTDLTQINAIGSFLLEIRRILVDFCVSPFLKFFDDEAFDLFDKVYQKIIPFIDKEQEEYKKAGGLINYLNNKYEKALEQKIFLLILEYRFFEAGAAAGNLLADIAQILAGFIMFLWSAGKLIVKGGKLALIKLLKLSATDKIKALAVIAAMYLLDLRYLKKIPQLTLDSPLISLVLENDEIKKISTALNNDISYFESKKVKILDTEAASNLIQDAKTPLIFESSAIGGESNYLMSLLGLYVLMRKRKSTAENVVDAVIEAQRVLFKPEYKQKLTGGYKDKGKTFALDSFIRKVAETEGIKIPDDAVDEEILQLLLNKWVPEFEKYIENLIKTGKEIKEKGIYTRFNYYINKKLREIAKEFNNQGLIILVDERFDSLLETTLNADAFALTTQKKIKIKNLFIMTIKDFYETFYPELKMNEGYETALKKILKTDQNAKELYEERDKFLKLIETGIAENKNKEEILKLTASYDSVNDEIFDRIEKLVGEGRLSSADQDQFLYSAFGKLNPLGKCGSARPDIGIMNILNGNSVYDFEHISNKGASNIRHKIGSSFYQHFLQVVFGNIPVADTITKDIPYKFSKGFIEKLSPEKFKTH